MGLFDGNMSFTDPNTLALLGATAALGDASMPSRLPIPTGALLAKAAGGLAAGSAAYKNQLEQQQANAASLTNAQTRATIDALRGRLGMQPITDEELKSGKFSGGGIYGNIGGAPQQSAITAPTPTEAAPANIVAPAASAAAPSGTDSGGGTLGPNQTVIASTLTGLGHSPAQIAGALGWGSAESPGKNGDTNTAATNNTGRDGQFGGAFGWQQWLAERRDALNVFAQQNGGNATDPAIQAKFFDHEMKTPGSGAGALAQQGYASATTPAEAVTAMAHYGRGEGYTANNPQNTVGFGTRLAAANHIFGGLGGNTQVAQAAPTTMTDMPQSAVGGTAAPAIVGQGAPVTRAQLGAAGGSGQAPTLPPPAVKMVDVPPAQNAQNVQNLPPDFRTMFTNRLINGAMGFKATPMDDYLASAANYPMGSPQQRLYLQGAAHLATGAPQMGGGERPGVPFFSINPYTGQPEIIGQNPKTEAGQNIGPGGTISTAPGFLGSDREIQSQKQDIENQGKIALAGGLLPSQAAAEKQKIDIANQAQFGNLLRPPSPVGGAMAPPDMAPGALSPAASLVGQAIPAPITPPTAPNAAPALVDQPSPAAPSPAQQIPLSHNPVPSFQSPEDYKRWNTTQSEAFDKGLTDTTEQLNKTYNPQNEKFRESLALTSQIADILPQLEGAMGWGGQTKLKASNILTALGVSPENVVKFTGLDPAAGQELNKMFLQLSAGAVRNMGAREPGSVIALFNNAFPNLETQPGAAKLMINALKMQAQWKIDEAAAAGEWGQAQKDNALSNGSQNYRGLDTFKDWFAKTHDPHDYWRAAAAVSDDPAIAWKGLNDTQRQRVYDLIPPGSVFRADDGKRYPKPATVP